MIGQEKVFVNANYQGDENFENEVSGVLKHVRTIHSMVGGNEEDFKFTVLKNVSSDQESRIRVVVVKILKILKTEEGYDKKAEKVKKMMDDFGQLLLSVHPKLWGTIEKYQRLLDEYNNKTRILYEDIELFLDNPSYSPNEIIQLSSTREKTIKYLDKIKERIKNKENEIKNILLSDFNI